VPVMLWLASCRPSDPVELLYRGQIEVEGHFRKPGELQRVEAELRFTTDGQDTRRIELSTWQAPDRSDSSTESTWLVGERVVGPMQAGWARQLAQALAAGGASVSRPYAHPRLGDVTDEVTVGPSTLALVRHELDHQWTASLELVSAEPATALTPPEPAPPPSPAPAGVQMELLADGVWEVRLEASDTRSLVVELERSLVVIEASLTSALGEQLVDTIRAKLPDKPIGYVLFGHYHPHYTGGLRAFIAEGATVLTPPGSAALVHQIAALPFTREPDRLARSPREPRVEVIGPLYTLEDRLQVLDIGSSSDHTDEYLIFYVPHAKLLFQGDLGYFAAEGGYRAPRRARGLLAAVLERGLEVETLVQGWPVLDQPRSVPFAEWRTKINP
jgi:glyoxylase-like metal-dependent hydrolase (beta-lactamase superfamily II)